MSEDKSEVEIVKDFFEDISKCQKLRLSINFNKLKEEGGFILIEDNLLFKLDLFNSFIGNKDHLFEEEANNLKKENSYLLNYKLKNLNPVLEKTQLGELLIQTKCRFNENKITLYDLENDFFIFIEEMNDTILMDVFYCIKNDALKNIERDFTILEKNFPNIFKKNKISSIDFKDSILYFVLLKKHFNLFTKQNLDTQRLIIEITEQFFEAQINGRHFAYYSIITLISLILEQNLVNMYHKATKTFPPEDHSLGQLKRDNTQMEYYDLVMDPQNKNRYQIIFKSASPGIYKKGDKIYQLLDDFTQNIRNKVFHYQRGIILDLEKSIFNAIKYFIDILMEIEKNDKYL